MPKKIVEKEVLLPDTRTYYNVKYSCKKCGKIYCRSCANKGLINGIGKMLAANKCPYCGALNQDKAAY